MLNLIKFEGFGLGLMMSDKFSREARQRQRLRIINKQ